MDAINQEFAKLKKNIEDKKVERVILRKQYRSKLQEIRKKQHLLEKQILARKWVQKIVKQTQNRVSGGIESLVTKALKTSLTNPYEFKFEFETRRNKTECDLFFRRNGHDLDPTNSSGGGSADVASFALRLTFWVLNSNLRPVLFMDEPFKFLSVDLQTYCSEMLAMMSEEMGIQLIIVSHLPRLIDHADRIIDIHLEDDISILEQDEVAECLTKTQIPGKKL